MAFVANNYPEKWTGEKEVQKNPLVAMLQQHQRTRQKFILFLHLIEIALALTQDTTNYKMIGNEL